MHFGRALVTLFLTAPIQLVYAIEPQDPALGKYPLDEKYHQTLVELGFLPSKPHLTDVEMAQQLKLELPELSAVKSALEAKDDKALEHALAEYLNAKLRPMRVEPTGQPPPNAELADQWLHPEITMGVGTNYPVGGTASTDTFALGDEVDWWRGSINAFVELSQWGMIRIVGDAYAKSGDTRYAEAMIRFVRSFYRTAARPPAQIPKTMFGCYGPWRSLNASGRIMNGYMPATYREIGLAPCVTDADRVMFLKMFWEHGQYCYDLMETPVAHNFELHVVRGLMDLSLNFPEFRQTQTWLERCAARLEENMRRCVLPDGIAYERTGYHFPYWSVYLREYERLRDGGAALSGTFAGGLEQMTEATIHLMSPALQFPLFGLGDMARWDNDMDRASGTFPTRADFAFAASGGQRGSPPEEVARVMPYAGWLTMRSDWSRDALYMAVNFNGNPRTQAGHYDQASFALWAFGRPIMTNPGTCQDYSLPEYNAYVARTVAANAVVVDDLSQDRWDNSGRLEAWENLPPAGPGFTFMSAVNESYRGPGGQHRRTVLFLRSAPAYWLMVDRLTGDDKPRHYRWVGHFQPTQLSMDFVAGTIATAAQDDKRLWMIPAWKESLRVEPGFGPMVTPNPTGAIAPFHPNRAVGPYVALRQSAVKGPAAFAVLLYPADPAEPAPVMHPLEAPHGAMGFAVRHAGGEDSLLLGFSRDMRTYGPPESAIVTDAEMAFLRRTPAGIREFAMTNGTSLRAGDAQLVEAGGEVSAVHARHDGQTLHVAARGRGEIRVIAQDATAVTLNGEPVQPLIVNGRFELHIGRPGEIVLSALRIETEPAARCKGSGVPLGYGGTFQGFANTALVSWTSSTPAQMTIEYQPENGTDWRRNVNPVPTTDHYYLLTDLEDGKRYRVRAVCRGADGTAGTIETVFQHDEPKSP